MKRRVKIYHWIVFLWAMLFVLRFELLVNYSELLFNHISLIFSDASSAFGLLNYRFVDASVSTLLFVSLAILLFFKRKSISFLSSSLNFSYAFLIIIGFVFLFAPIISNDNPEFSKDLSVTKLLPPLSSVIQLEQKNSVNDNFSEQAAFRLKLEKVIRPAFNNEVIFADSVVTTENAIVYFQNNKSLEIDKSRIMTEDNLPAVSKRFFLLGTDEFGRDLFVRLLYGTRISVSVGLGAVLVSFLIGIILGFLSGYKGGLLDSILNRFTEVFLAFPVIYLVVLILALFGSSLLSVIIVLGLSGWMSLFKIVKTEVLAIKHKDYFLSAQLIGLTKFQLLSKEIFPVIVAPILVNLVFLFSNVVLAEAALSYLGLGTGNSYPSWGSMISSGQEYITKAWWLIAFPGLSLVLTLFSFNSSGRLIGRVFNPRLKL